MRADCGMIYAKIQSNDRLGIRVFRLQIPWWKLGMKLGWSFNLLTFNKLAPVFLFFSEKSLSPTGVSPCSVQWSFIDGVCCEIWPFDHVIINYVQYCTIQYTRPLTGFKVFWMCILDNKISSGSRILHLTLVQYILRVRLMKSFFSFSW